MCDWEDFQEISLKTLFKPIFLYHLNFISYFSESNFIILVLVNIVVLSISVLLPYPCRPIYKFCKNLPGNLILKPRYFSYLMLCICAEILLLILSVYGFSPMLEYYQVIIYFTGNLMGKSINLIALSLAGIGVTYISNESQKVFIYLEFYVSLYDNSILQYWFYWTSVAIWRQISKSGGGELLISRKILILVL